jgi:hypothetical protein
MRSSTPLANRLFGVSGRQMARRGDCFGQMRVEPTSCCALPGGYCLHVDTLFNHDGVHVIDVGWRRRDEIDRLCLTVETHPWPVASPGCGVLAVGRRLRQPHDVPVFGEPVELVWRARRYRSAEPLCRGGSFTEDSDLAGSGALLTNRAAWWAIGCLQRDTASVAALARRLGVDWHRVGNHQAAAGAAGRPTTRPGIRVWRCSGSMSTSGTTPRDPGRAPTS